MGMENIGANVEEILDDPESPTGEQDTPKNDPEENNQEDQQDEDESGDDDKTPFHKIPRFKEVIQEKNEYKRKFEQLQSELYELKNQKPSNSKEDVNFEYVDYWKELEGESKRKFEKSYSAPEDIAKDIYNAVMNDLSYLNTKSIKETETKREQIQNTYQQQLDAIDKYFGDDTDRRNEFYKSTQELIEKKAIDPTKVDLWDVLTLYETYKSKGESINTKKRSTLNAMGSGKSKPMDRPQGYDPIRDRNKSPSQLVDEYFKT